jgi:ADP-ribosylation factor-like protein 2
MGLLSIIKKTKAKEREMRILVLGLDNAGKTTCIKRFNNQDITTISPTLGFQICPLQFRGFTLNLWDIGGQQSLRSYWRNYFEATDGIVWVVDCNDAQRLTDCRRELHALLLEERLAGASLLLLLNKSDIPTALPPAEVAEAIGVAELRSGRRHVHMVRCSAVTGEGLLDGMEWITKDVSSRIYMN